MTKALDWDYSALAASYDSRVDYAGALVDRVLRDIGLAGGDAVVDVGAGTGKLTGLLCDAGADVIALEPNAAMRAVARDKVVGRRARWVAAHGERMPLPSQAMRLVTYGSSFNVMPAQAALDECHRVLRDGGHWLAAWNHRDLDDGLQREVEGIIARHLPEYDYGRRRSSPEADVLAHGGFVDLRFREQRFVAELPARAWLDAWQSHATLQRQAGARLSLILGDIEACVGATETLRIPYFTRIWTSRRCPA